MHFVNRRGEPRSAIDVVFFELTANHSAAIGRLQLVTEPTNPRSDTLQVTLVHVTGYPANSAVTHVILATPYRGLLSLSEILLQIES
jgi:hypothetical protein